MFRIEPVPASERVGLRVLFGVEDEEIILLGNLIHSRRRGQVLRLLHTAMEHHDKWGRLLRVITRRDPQLISPRTSRVSHAAAYPFARVCQGRKCQQAQSSCDQNGSASHAFMT